MLQGDIDGAVLTAPKPAKRITLGMMLRWAYNSQMVDVLSGRLIDEDQHAFVIGEPPGVASSRFSALGTRVDNAGSNRFARNEIHPDAELLHDHVLALGPIYARLVIHYGKTGMHPEPETAIARPRPASIRGDRIGQGIWRGEACRYRIEVAETIVERKEHYIERGRKGVELAYTEIIRHEVLFCPVEWWPDIAWVEATNQVAEHWDDALARLRDSLSRVDFISHEIIGEGVL
jgi:hypothetical protein